MHIITKRFLTEYGSFGGLDVNGHKRKFILSLYRYLLFYLLCVAVSYQGFHVVISVSCLCFSDIVGGCLY